MQQPQLFRAINPLATQLARSTAAFTLRVEGLARAPTSLEAECARVGAACSVVRRDEPGNPWGSDVLEIRGSHAVLDAFAGMHLVSAFADALQPHLIRGEDPFVVRGAIDDFAFCVYVEQVDARRGERSIAQRVLGRILARLPELAPAAVAICAARDPIDRIGRDTFTGNSLVMVEKPATAIAALAAGPRDEWVRYLTEQGDRIAALALRRPHLLRSSAALSFTAMGDVRRIPWASEAVDPRSFALVASPASTESANVGCWSSGPYQALNLCGRADHPVMRRRAEVADAWRAALEEG